MPTDTVRSRARATSFILRAVAWSLGLFGLLRLNWVEAHAILPLTHFQGQLAVWLCGTPALPVDVTLACSGADALSLCLGAILAYPASWRMRLAGTGGGVALVLLLNTLRIGTRGLVTASPAWCETLHVYVWPAVLIMAVAGYVFWWMGVADGGPGIGNRLRFIILAAVFLFVFIAASPLYLENSLVFTVAAFIARAAAAVLLVFGIEAHAAANVLWTSRGGFAVTQECISTPLIPIFLAAVFAYAVTWRQRLGGLLATVPLFIGLGVARLLVVALPAALVASPLFLIHAFYQLLLALVVVCIAAFWRHGSGTAALRRALTGIALGTAVACLLGAPYAHVMTRAAETMVGLLAPGVVAGTPLDDPQGAIMLLPAFQMGFYVALWVAAFVAAGWRRFLSGLTVLAVTQVAILTTLFFVASYAGFTPHVRDVRAWALAGPLLAVAAVVNIGRLLRRPTPAPPQVR